MKIEVFSVYDSKAMVFDRPFYALTNGSALRQFMDAVNDEKSILHKHPQDFMLFHLGTFDDQDGKLTGLSVVENLGVASSVKETPSPVVYNPAASEK